MSLFREARLLRMRYELEQLVTEREGMVAANHARAVAGLAQAYTDEAFQIVAQTIARLAPDPDAWDSRCSRYRAILVRISDRTAFDTVIELKNMAAKALAKATA
jgi:hypothetical protein